MGTDSREASALRGKRHTKKRRAAGELISTAFERRWAMYALAAGAGVLGTGSLAHAEILYTQTNVDVKTGAIYIDLNADGVNDFKVVDSHYSAPNGYGFRNNLSATPLGSGGGIGLNGRFAAAVKAGQVIGPQGKFGAGLAAMVFECEIYSGCSSAGGPWGQASDRYLALKFNIDGQTHYGWAEFSVRYEQKGYQNYINTHLLGYAYETEANTAIVAGQTSGNAEDSGNVPEDSSSGVAPAGNTAGKTAPSRPAPVRDTLGMLALGAAGLTVLRRLRSA